MEIEDRTAPSYEQLRQLKPISTDRFPVYPNLVDTLVSARSHPDPKIAHTMAVCAGYAYSTTHTLETIMARMGLERNRCRMITESVDPMFIRSTAFVLQSLDGRVVILSYRGVEPTSLINWLTTVDEHRERVPIPVPGAQATMWKVHGGFYRNTRATRYAIIEALRRCRKGQPVFDDGTSVQPMEALYITGHSLGGAMAVLLATLLVAQPEHYKDVVERLRAVYTFGQPMVGEPDFAKACQRDDFLRRNVVRYVYQRDLVPHLPPTAMDPYQHFGQQIQYSKGKWNSNSKPAKQVRHLLYLLMAPIAFLASQFRWTRWMRFRYSVDDHLPHHYIAALKPDDVSSEFGDW